MHHKTLAIPVVTCAFYSEHRQNYILMSFVVCSLHWILLSWIKKDGGVRRPWKERNDLGKPAFDGRI